MIAAELSSVRIRGVFSPLVDLIELAGILLVVYFGTRAIAGGGLRSAACWCSSPT